MAPEKIVLRFSADTADKPIIYHLAKEYDLIANILKASINPIKKELWFWNLQVNDTKKGLII